MSASLRHLGLGMWLWACPALAQTPPLEGLQRAPAAAPPPGALEAALPRPPPLADALLLPSYAWDITGAHFQILRGGGLLNDSLTAEGLSRSLSRSPGAAALAGDAHRQLVLGNTLYYVGLLAVLVGVVGVTAGAAQPTDSGAQVGLGTAGGLCVLGGAISTVVGAISINAGIAKVLDAVNLYNLDLIRANPAP